MFARPLVCYTRVSHLCHPFLVRFSYIVFLVAFSYLCLLVALGFGTLCPPNSSQVFPSFSIDPFLPLFGYLVDPFPTTYLCGP